MMKALVFSDKPLPLVLSTCLSEDYFECPIVVNPDWAHMSSIQDHMDVHKYDLICVNGEYGLTGGHSLVLVTNILQCKHVLNRLYVPVVLFLDKPKMELVEKFIGKEVDYVWHGLHVPTERDSSFGNIIYRIWIMRQVRNVRQTKGRLVDF